MPDSVIDGFFVQKLTRQLASSEAINNFEANLVLPERNLLHDSELFNFYMPAHIPYLLSTPYKKYLSF